MKIHQIYAGNLLRNFHYLVELRSKSFFSIDPWDAPLILDFIENSKGKLLGIINTHEHHDHTRGNQELVEKTGCRVYVHEKGRGQIPNATDFLKKGDILPLEDGHEFEIMDTPGHTFAHLCLLLKKDQRPLAVFSGDTLFNAGVGNCYNGGDPEVLYETISEQFQSLPDDVIVYPGHEYLKTNLEFTLDKEPGNSFAKDFLAQQENVDWFKHPIQTNIGLEKKINTFMRLKEVSLLNNVNGPKDSKEVFLKLRDLRNKW